MSTDSELDDVIQEFLVESFEGLELIEQSLVTLEKSPTDPELLASIFRTLHTIKGTCSFFDFDRLEALAHEGENLLSAMRENVVVLTEEIFTTLLELVDAIRQFLSNIQNNGSEGDADHSALTERIAHLATRGIETGEKETGQDHNLPPNAHLFIDEQHQTATQASTAQPESSAAENERADNTAPSATPLGEAKASSVPETSPIQQQRAVDSSLRIDVRLLDDLMNLVGELVLARNQILLHRDVDRSNQFNTVAQAIEPDHLGAAGKCHEDTNAADQHALEQTTENHQRHRPRLRQKGRDGQPGKGYGTRQNHGRSAPRSADSHDS